MFLWMYTLLLSALGVLALPFACAGALVFPRVRKGLPQRLGLLPKDLLEQAALSEGCVWVHAASLGEVNAVAPVVRELVPRLPRQALVITCTTAAGREQARRLFPQAACLMMPLDLPFLVAPWIRRFRPRLAVIAETELWPNFLAQLKAHGVQILVANGRLTERSRRRYGRLGRAFAGVLEHVDLFAMQSQADAERVISLGARPARVVTVGNTKFDLAGDLGALRIDGANRRRELGWKAGAPVVVAGSTRPGEEKGLLEAFAEVQRRVPTARLVLAPRHLERVLEVEGLLKAGKWQWARRSTGADAADADVLLLDTLGELRSFYALACDAGVAWVGGSFGDFGGQNPLEPAALGVPVLFGPHMEHFAESSAALLECGGAKQVAMGELAGATIAFLRDATLRKAAGLQAEQCVLSRAGASKATADLAMRLLLVTRMLREGHLWRGEGLESFRKVSEFGSASAEPEWVDERHEGALGGREFGTGLEGGRDGEV